MTFNLSLTPYAFCLGVRLDIARNTLYVLPFPMVQLALGLPDRRHWLVDEDTGKVLGSCLSSDLEHCLRQDRCTSIAYWSKHGSTEPLFGPDHLADL